MKNQIFIFSFFVSLFLLPSCGVNLYVPNTLNTPLLHEKGDFNANLGFVTLAPEPTFDLQGAYAVNNHVAVMLNSSFMNSTSSADYKNTHRLIEGGGGLYTTFGPHANGWRFGRAEIMVGYGFGRGEDNSPDTRYTGRYNRAFLQPAIGIEGEWFHLSFGARLNSIVFSDYRRSVNGIVEESATFGFSTFEPVLNMELGYRSILFFSQIGGEAIVSGEQNYNRVSSMDDNGIFNIGMRFRPWIEGKNHAPPVAFSSTGFTSTPDGDIPIMPAEILVPEDDVQLCFQSGTVPADWEVIDVVFKGAFLARRLQLSSEAKCFDIKVRGGSRGNLRFLVRDEGDYEGGSILLTVTSAKEEQWYYFDVEREGKEEVVLRVKE